MAFVNTGALRAHHLALISMIIGFLSGYDSGVAGGILTFPSFQDDFGYSGADAVKQVQALTVSLQLLGCFLSCFVAGITTEKLGRRVAIRLYSAIFVIGVVLQTAPTRNLGAWYFARIVSGVGQGGLTVAVPIFTAEMAPIHIRGRLGSLYQWMFTLGIFVAYWINYNYGTQQIFAVTDSRNWQIPVALQMISGSILFAGMFTVPESVRWLLKKGRDEEAWKSLVWVRADSGSAVQTEFDDIRKGLALEKTMKSGLRLTEMLRGENRSRLISGCLIFLFQQATGGSALAYFSPQFFQLLVGKGPRDLLLTALFGAVKLIACSFFILFLASRIGRRKPLIYGAFFMAFCMLPIAIILRVVPISSNASKESVPPSGIATIALVFLNVMFYNLSWGPLPWAYVPEIFPNRTREMGVAICLTVHWLFNFVFTFSTPYMISGTGQRGWGTFLFYAVFDVVMAVWVIFFMKETQDKSLELVNREIDGDMRDPVSMGDEERINEPSVSSSSGAEHGIETEGGVKSTTEATASTSHRN